MSLCVSLYVLLFAVRISLRAFTCVFTLLWRYPGRGLPRYCDRPVLLLSVITPPDGFTTGLRMLRVSKIQ